MSLWKSKDVFAVSKLKNTFFGGKIMSAYNQPLIKHMHVPDTLLLLWCQQFFTFFRMLRECFEEEEGRYEQLSRCSFVICIVVVIIQGSVKKVHGEGRKKQKKKKVKKNKIKKIAGYLRVFSWILKELQSFSKDPCVHLQSSFLRTK